MSCDAPDKLFMGTDRAIRLALLVTELVTNAAKHAYPDGRRGRIWVRVTQASVGIASVSVRDEGVGLPPSFDIDKGRGLGMRLAKGAGATGRWQHRHHAPWLGHRVRDRGALVVVPRRGQLAADQQSSTTSKYSASITLCVLT